MHTAVRVRVDGIVQGVGYRFWARMEAERLGIDGWIRNEPDGGVVAHLEGPVDSIQTMIRGMWTGPRWCHVTNVEVEDATNHGYASFTTEY